MIVLVLFQFLLCNSWICLIDVMIWDIMHLLACLSWASLTQKVLINVFDGASREGNSWWCIYCSLCSKNWSNRRLLSSLFVWYLDDFLNFCWQRGSGFRCSNKLFSEDCSKSVFFFWFVCFLFAFNSTQDLCCSFTFFGHVIWMKRKGFLRIGKEKKR